MHFHPLRIISLVFVTEICILSFFSRSSKLLNHCPSAYRNFWMISVFDRNMHFYPVRIVSLGFVTEFCIISLFPQSSKLLNSIHQHIEMSECFVYSTQIILPGSVFRICDRNCIMSLQYINFPKFLGFYVIIYQCIKDLNSFICIFTLSGSFL